MNDLLRVLGITYVFTFLVVLTYGLAEVLFGKPMPPIEIVEVGQPKEEEQRPPGAFGLRKESIPGTFVHKSQERKFTNWPTNYQAAWLEQTQHESIFREQDIHFAQDTEEKWSTIHFAQDTSTATPFLWGTLNGTPIEFQPTQASIPIFELLQSYREELLQGYREEYSHWPVSPQPVPEAYRISDEQAISLEDARRILDLSDARDPDNVAEAEDAWEIAHFLLETPTWQEVVKSEWVCPLEYTPCFEQIVRAVLDGEKKYGKLP